MIRISGINRKIDVETGVGGDYSCNAILVAGNDTNYNKARFRLTADEAQRFDDLTREIEKRIGESVLAPAYNSDREIVPIAPLPGDCDNDRNQNTE